MIGVSHFKLLAAIGLLLLGVLIARTLMKRDKLATSALDLDDLLLDTATNRISKAAAVLMGSFALASWVVIYHTLAGKLTDTEFGAYLLTFATPAVVKIIRDGKAGDSTQDKTNGPAP